MRVALDPKTGRWKVRARPLLVCLALLSLVCLAAAAPLPAAQQNTPAPPGSAARAVGTVKSVSGSRITLTTDAGADVQIVIQDATRIVKIPPGQKDLKNATPLQLQDIEAGDRLLVGGRLAEDGQSVSAITVIVNKRAEIEQLKQQEAADWQKRGIGGLVSSVDATGGTITITTTVAGTKKSITIQVARDTILRRYAPDSVKFEDAKPSTLGQIQPGDQVRARGAISQDGSAFAAEEIVSGAFHNISGTISSIDPAKGTLSVKDLATKKLFVVNVTPDSQVRRLPPFIAMRIAARLKGAPAGAPAGGGASGGPPAGAAYSASPGGGPSAGPRAGGGGMDLQQLISRMPASTLNDFQKGDAVMIVSTEGTAAGVTAITLLGGVEPILEASPNGTGGLLLAPWNLSAPSGDASGGQ
ncbi:MAG TPA: hypothetical protein VEH50_13985 [Methylomirabilota bacterium]|nr:hypothetical protein [Methylomirabilota bacterium]